MRARGARRDVISVDKRASLSKTLTFGAPENLFGGKNMKRTLVALFLLAVLLRKALA